MYQYTVIDNQTHDLHAGMVEIHYKVEFNGSPLCHGRIWDSRGKWAYTCHADKPVEYEMLNNAEKLVPKEFWKEIFRAPGLAHNFSD